MPGYPQQILDQEPTDTFKAVYLQNSMTIDSPEYQSCKDAVKKAQIW